MMKNNSNIYVACFIGLCEATGLVGSFFTSKSIPVWYSNLKKPEINPPSWIFAPVWTLLYAMMGWAAAIIFEKKEKRNMSIALVFFGVQLIMNFMWTIIFFGLRSPLVALIEIFLLWIAIILTIAAFWCVSKKAALLLIPYLLWVTFASVLNFEIWRINK